MIKRMGKKLFTILRAHILFIKTYDTCNEWWEKIVPVRASRSEGIFDFSNFSTKTYVVGTQKNRLNKTVLLSTQKHVLTDG